MFIFAGFSPISFTVQVCSIVKTEVENVSETATASKAAQLFLEAVKQKSTGGCRRNGHLVYPVSLGGCQTMSSRVDVPSPCMHFMEYHQACNKVNQLNGCNNTTFKFPSAVILSRLQDPQKCSDMEVMKLTCPWKCGTLYAYRDPRDGSRKRKERSKPKHIIVQV